MKLVLFIKQIEVNHCSKRTSYDIYKNIQSLQNITLFEKIFRLYFRVYTTSCYCFILQVLYLSYTRYFYTLCLLFISDCDSSSLIEVNFLGRRSYWILGELLSVDSVTIM